MKHTSLSLSLAFFAVITLAAQTQLPTRKAGLWESTMTGTSSLAAEGGGKTKIKHCIDASTDQAAMTGAMAGKACKQGPIVKTAAGYEMEATCNMGGMTSKSKSIISGDFNSQVTVDVTSQISMGGGPAKESKTKIEARYVGACEAGQKPGDIIMPDGKVMRMPVGGQ